MGFLAPHGEQHGVRAVELPHLVHQHGRDSRPGMVLICMVCAPLLPFHAFTGLDDRGLENRRARSCEPKTCRWNLGHDFQCGPAWNFRVRNDRQRRHGTFDQAANVVAQRTGADQHRL